MRNSATWLVGLCLLAACQTHQTLVEQVKATFSKRVQSLDPAISVDSVRILWIVPVTQKLGRIIDDTVYMREYARLNQQLERAIRNGNKDTIDFYHYELQVMKNGIDSVNRDVKLGDTTHRYGSLISCAYYLRRDASTLTDSTLIYIDAKNTLQFTGMLDSAFAHSIHKLPH